MNDRKEVEALIREHGGVLERQKKHCVYRFPDGRSFTLASTPSDSIHAEPNNLARLRRFLGIHREVHKNAARRRKPGAPAPAIPPPPPAPLVDFRTKLEPLLRVKPFRPRPCCLPVHLERLPRTPIFAILLHLFPLPERHV